MRNTTTRTLFAIAVAEHGRRGAFIGCNMTKVQALADFLFKVSFSNDGGLVAAVEEWKRSEYDLCTLRCEAIAEAVGHGVKEDDVWQIFCVIRAVVEEVKERKEEEETEKAIAMLDEFQAFNAV
jgi:hypothetical protein